MKKFLLILLCLAASVGITNGYKLISYSEKIELPEKYVHVSSLSFAYDSPWSSNTGAKYIGGDAYNYLIEASLKAGYYNAVSNEKTITYVGGILLLFTSIFTFFAGINSLVKCSTDQKQLEILQEISHNTKNAQPITNESTQKAPSFSVEENRKETSKTETSGINNNDNEPELSNTVSVTTATPQKSESYETAEIDVNKNSPKKTDKKEAEKKTIIICPKTQIDYYDTLDSEKDTLLVDVQLNKEKKQIETHFTLTIGSPHIYEYPNIAKVSVDNNPRADIALITDNKILNKGEASNFVLNIPYDQTELPTVISIDLDMIIDHNETDKINYELKPLWNEKNTSTED